MNGSITKLLDCSPSKLETRGDVQDGRRVQDNFQESEIGDQQLQGRDDRFSTYRASASKTTLSDHFTPCSTSPKPICDIRVGKAKILHATNFVDKIVTII